MFSGMMKILKMSCEDVYPLISESQDHTLPFSSRMRLKIHITICGLCQIYKKQLAVICRVAKVIGKEDVKILAESNMKPETKEKIQQWIEKKR